MIKKKAEDHQLQPTFFEFTTALTFLYFAQQKVDYAVVEVGLGGRLDATNVLNPLVSVITNISLDHTQYLGETKLEIAGEKAAIIKENSLVVTGEEDNQVLELFKEVCLEKSSQLVVLSKENDLEDSNLKIQMLGKHQLKNAALAKKVIGVSGIKVPSVAIRKGLEQAEWPGRLQVVHEQPLVVLDGAHNVEGMNKLKEFVSDLMGSRKFNKKILVLGMAKDKEIGKMLPLIIFFFDEFILTQGNFKPTELEVLEKEINGCLAQKKTIFKINHPKKAMEKAAQLAKKEDLVLVTGSLYMVGDVLKYVPDFNKLFKGTKASAIDEI